MTRIIQSLNVSFFMVVYAFVPAALSAAPPWPDAIIDFGYVDGVGELCTQQCHAYCTSFRLQGDNTRVLTNVEGILDSEGYIRDDKKEALISDGVVSKTARLRIRASIPAGPTENGTSVTSFGFSLNGKAGGSFSVVYGSHHTDTSFDFEVPIEAVKFPLFKTPAGIGATLQPPDPAINELNFTHSVFPGGVPGECGDHDSCSFGAFLKFDVLAPIVMIHGMGSKPDWFYKNGFVQPFQDSGKPFIVLPAPGGEEQIRDGLEDAVAARIEPDLSKIAEAFGADRFHLIGHSKGGLYGRVLATRSVGIFSLTTLDTPHEGSPMADYLVALDAHLISLLIKNVMLVDVLVYRAGHRYQRPDAYSDLRVDYRQRYNAGHLLPKVVKGGDLEPRNEIAYEAVASDAKNQSGALDAEGYHGSLVAKKMYRTYQTTKLIDFTYTNGKITGGNVVTPVGPVGNDLIVPVGSQQYSGSPAGSPPFLSLPTGQVLFRNHTTVGKPDVGEIVSQRLTVSRQAELKR